MRRAGRRGFTLLEVLVATTILAVAVGALLGSLSASMNNASRLTEKDRAALEAKRILDEMLVDTALARGQVYEGRLDPGLGLADGRWRARISEFESGPYGQTLERAAVEIIWESGRNTRTFPMEGFRIAK
jgi:general secretion pathway protein I